MAYRTPRIGTISEGTLRDVDLVDSFHDELLWLLNGEAAPEYASLLARVVTYLDSDDDDGDEGSELVNDLMDALQEFAPPFMYFGSAEGDGACFGWWADVDGLESDDDVLKVDDLAAIPADYVGDVMIVNDHGNVTYGHATNGDFKSAWSCV